MNKIAIYKYIAVLFAVLSLTACVTATPIETQNTVDDRPLLFFVSDNAAPADGLDIYIDGLYMGKAADFVNMKKGLAVVSGTHIVEIRRGSSVVTTEKVYLGSGTNKTLPIDAR